MSSSKELLQKAKNYAFLLLKFRPRSEKEIYCRLKKKKFDEKIVKEILFFLKDKNFIDDRAFARSWIESRLKKPLGLRKIKQELKIKGINNQIIDEQIWELKSNYCEQDIVEEIARKRFGKLRYLEPQKAKKRVYEYLLRRGFSPDTVIAAINNL